MVQHGLIASVERELRALGGHSSSPGPPPSLRQDPNLSLGPWHHGQALAPTCELTNSVFPSLQSYSLTFVSHLPVHIWVWASNLQRVIIVLVAGRSYLLVVSRLWPVFEVVRCNRASDGEQNSMKSMEMTGPIRSIALIPWPVIMSREAIWGRELYGLGNKSGLASNLAPQQPAINLPVIAQLRCVQSSWEVNES